MSQAVTQSPEDKSKRFVLTITFFFLLPPLILFGIIDLSRESTLVGFLDWLLALQLIISLIALRRGADVNKVVLSIVVSMFIMMSYVLMIGSANGRAFVWFYFVPMGAFYFFGLRNGFYVVLLSYLISIVAFFFSPWYEYETIQSIRYLVTYSTVVGLSGGLEAARARYEAQMIEEKKALQQALDDVRTLHGLLPICSSCKKIRDDSGYWNQLEQYISENADVQFSHGLCPDCTKKYSAELDELDGEIPHS